MSSASQERLRALVEKSVSELGGYLSVGLLAEKGQERKLGRQPAGPAETAMRWIEGLMLEHGPGRFRVRLWQAGGRPVGSVVVQAEPDTSEKPPGQGTEISRPESPVSPPPDPRLRILEEQLRAVQAQYSALSQRYEQQTKDFNRHAEKIRAERDEARRLYQGEAAQRHALAQQQQMAQRSFATLEAEKRVMEQRLAALENEKRILEQRLDASTRLTSAPRVDEERLRAENKAIQTENSSLRAENHGLRAELTRREELRQRTATRLQNLQRRVLELQASNNRYVQRDIDFINSIEEEEDCW